MSTFKYGQKVTHPLHGKGKVGNYYPESDVVTVYFEDDYDSRTYGTQVQPDELAAYIDPWRPVKVKWTSGETTNTRIRQSEVVGYLKNLPIDRIAAFDLGESE